MEKKNIRYIQKMKFKKHKEKNKYTHKVNEKNELDGGEGIGALKLYWRFICEESPTLKLYQELKIF